MPNLCRDCLSTKCPNNRCPNCWSPRILHHPELFSLSIAHLDCDSFYASIEKREHPDLADKPLIIGGGKRGVVSTACYIARIQGVRSAMPMFQALKICPDAVILKPRMSLYAKVSKDINQIISELTPSVEPLSLDEAFIDLAGTRILHGASPAEILAKLAKRIHSELGLTVSIGLSHNKFLAKIASDLDKPRGFSIIGKAETRNFLQDKPVKLIWGIGKTTQKLLAASGIRTFKDLMRWDREELGQKFGKMGERLWYLGRGEDKRRVEARVFLKSVSNETTFIEDTSDIDLLYGHLWRMCEKVSSRMKAKGLIGCVVTLKLKTSAHKIITKRTTLREATQLADTIYFVSSNFMRNMDLSHTYRLLGVGVSDLCSVKEEDIYSDLLDTKAFKRGKAERASDSIRERFGPDAIIKGRALR